MSKYSGLDSQLSTAMRKQKLLQEGAAFRAEMLASRDIVRANLNTRSLTTILLGRVSGIASSIFRNRDSLKPGNLPAMLPLLVTGVSWLSKRGGARKPLFIGAAVIAAIGGAAFLSRRKSKATTDDE